MDGDSLAVVGRALLAGVLLLAGASKIGHRDDLQRVVLGYRLVGVRTSRVVAMVLPVAEVVVGLGVASAVASPAPELAAAGLFGGFAAALAVNLLRGRRDLECGCFGFHTSPEAARISWSYPLRALGLAAGAGLVGLAGPVDGDGTALAACALAGLVTVAGGAALAVRRVVTA